MKECILNYVYDKYNKLSIVLDIGVIYTRQLENNWYV